MGQTVFAVMYAVEIKQPRGEAAQERVYLAAKDFELPAAYNEDLVGIEIAVGGSGREGAGEFEYITCRLDQLEDHEQLAPFIVAARAAWPGFVAHMKAFGKLNIKEPPRLWLTTTEVA